MLNNNYIYTQVAIGNRRRLGVSCLVLTLPLDHHSKANRLSQPHSITPPTQLGVNDTQRWVDLENLPIPADSEHNYISQMSRGPSVTQESVPAAEYREWPFEGRIGHETTYNLEFKLPGISKCLTLPVEACDNCSNVDLSVTPTRRLKAPYFKASTPASRPRTKVAWMPEDDTRLVDLKNGGSSISPSLTGVLGQAMCGVLRSLKAALQRVTLIDLRLIKPVSQGARYIVAL